MTRRYLGAVVRLQIHREPLARDSGYDPAHLVTVERLAVGALGVAGRVGDDWVLDVHHRAHPEARGDGRRAVSLGFAGHYRLMAERFGAVPFGVGAENLVLDTDARVLEDDLTGEVVITGDDGELVLTGARAARPCRQFTSFLLGRSGVAPRDEIASEMEFLGEGMRGFILATDLVVRPVPVHLGDEVWVDPG
jgi:hypothetical protein